MYLKSIELSGFKSFAKKNGFTFNTPISAIVGPNGSGKSNVAEAFRFVLGEQSIKSMRGKRGEDLIWNGAQNEPRGNRASVKVVFDNERRVFDMDFSEVSIERVVSRDGLNEYFINGSTVRLKDIIELLAKAHIGASGHHIISQGEADKVISASPKDRKSMVEDALGLKLYQYKKVESDRKFKKTFENIGQVESLRKEIAPHLKFLKKQVEKLEKTESLREELLDTAKIYFKIEEHYLAEIKKSLEQERTPLDESLKKLSKESKEAKEVLELESSLNDAKKHKDAITRELGQLEGLIMAEEQGIKREEQFASSEELKTIRLKEVEELYAEVSLWTEVGKIVERIKSFIQERKHERDLNLVHAAEKKLDELKQKKQALESSLKSADEKERSISEAERVALKSESLEKELASKLNLLRLREEAWRTEEATFKRDLEELGRLIGSDVLQFRNASLVHGEVRDVQIERRRSMEKQKIRFEDASVAGSDEILKEYRETSERDEFLSRELTDLEKSAESLKSLIKELENRLATEFQTGIDNINKEFGKLFSTVFGGGEAELVLTREGSARKSLANSSDVVSDEHGQNLLDDSLASPELEEGLEIKLNLPRKKVKSLMMLSGGERALTSIALIFAISAVNPPPFIILDETDAALDEANSKKYGDMIEMLSKYSQLILITHNRETMSRAGVIYGVTMGSNGISKVLSISFDEASEVAK